MNIFERIKSYFNRLSHLEPQWKWFFPIYLFLAMANLRTKMLITHSLTDGTLISNHTKLLNGDFTAPEQYRLLQYWVPEFIHRVLGVSVIDAYLLQRLVWTVLTFCVFHLFLRKWFSGKVAMIGTLFLAATMHWTYLNHLQESEPLNLFLFLVGFWAIRENAFWALMAILILGSFNKLTVIYLPLAYFFCWFKSIDLKWLLLRAVALTIPVVAICGAIRWYFKDTKYMTSFLQIDFNINGIINDPVFHLAVISLYGAFWILAFLSYREKPLFFRRAALIVPLFIITHFLIARIFEIRLFLPLAPIIIPMGLFHLLKEDKTIT